MFYDTIYIIWISLPESKSKRSCSKETPSSKEMMNPSLTLPGSVRTVCNLPLN